MNWRKPPMVSSARLNLHGAGTRSLAISQDLHLSGNQTPDHQYHLQHNPVHSMFLSGTRRHGPNCCPHESFKTEGLSQSGPKQVGCSLSPRTHDGYRPEERQCLEIFPSNHHKSRLVDHDLRPMTQIGPGMISGRPRMPACF